MDNTLRLSGFDLTLEEVGWVASFDSATRQWRLNPAVTIENMPILTWNDGGNPS